MIYNALQCLPTFQVIVLCPLKQIEEVSTNEQTKDTCAVSCNIDLQCGSHEIYRRHS